MRKLSQRLLSKLPKDPLMQSQDLNPKLSDSQALTLSILHWMLSLVFSPTPAVLYSSVHH